MFSTIRYAKLNPNAKSPFRKNPTDAGLDFYALEEVAIPPHSMIILKTGITIEIPKNFVLLIKPKGKNNHLIGAGVVDAFYEIGEILIKVANISENFLQINEGDAIAQGIFIPIETPEPKEVSLDELKNNSSRSGKGGIVTQSKIPQELIR
jgi:dUTP pyrophosphatase